MRYTGSSNQTTIHASLAQWMSLELTDTSHAPASAIVQVCMF